MVAPVFHNADGELVEYDGSPLSWRVSVYGLVIKDGALLLLKNSEEKLHDIPGGGVEEQESLAEALQREALEEAGAEVAMGELVYHVSDYFYHRELGTFFKTLQLFYRAELRGELRRPTDARTEWVGFVPWQKLSEYGLPEGVKVAIRSIVL